MDTLTLVQLGIWLGLPLLAFLINWLNGPPSWWWQRRRRKGKETDNAYAKSGTPVVDTRSDYNPVPVPSRASPPLKPHDQSAPPHTGEGVAVVATDQASSQAPRAMRQREPNACTVCGHPIAGHTSVVLKNGKGVQCVCGCTSEQPVGESHGARLDPVTGIAVPSGKSVPSEEFRIGGLLYRRSWQEAVPIDKRAPRTEEFQIDPAKGIETRGPSGVPLQAAEDASAERQGPPGPGEGIRVPSEKPVPSEEFRIDPATGIRTSGAHGVPLQAAEEASAERQAPPVPGQGGRAMRTCKRCNYVVPFSSLQFCNQCGARLELTLADQPDALGEELRGRNASTAQDKEAPPREAEAQAGATTHESFAARQGQIDPFTGMAVPPEKRAMYGRPTFGRFVGTVLADRLPYRKKFLLAGSEGCEWAAVKSMARTALSLGCALGVADPRAAELALESSAVPQPWKTAFSHRIADWDNRLQPGVRAAYETLFPKPGAADDRLLLSRHECALLLGDRVEGGLVLSLSHPSEARRVVDSWLNQETGWTALGVGGLRVHASPLVGSTEELFHHVLQVYEAWQRGG